MSAQSQLNSLLDPYLFQVIGSTPESIRDAILKSNLKGNSKAAIQLAAIAVFAAAVNKPTMENFVSKPELYEARPFINAIFTISGRANMTGLTLLGHCLMTTDHLTGVSFCDELRKKMGQRSLWDGNLESGSLSEKQGKIMKEKKRVIQEKSARVLGSCFFKHTGIDKTAMNAGELEFWQGLSTISEPAQAAGSQSVMPPPPRPEARKASVSSARNVSPPASVSVLLSSGVPALIPKTIYDYYKSSISPDEPRLVASIEKRGIDGFIREYSLAMQQDPEGRGTQGGTVYNA